MVASQTKTSNEAGINKDLEIGNIKMSKLHKNLEATLIVQIPGHKEQHYNVLVSETEESDWKCYIAREGRFKIVNRDSNPKKSIPLSNKAKAEFAKHYTKEEVDALLTPLVVWMEFMKGEAPPEDGLGHYQRYANRLMDTLNKI